MNGLSSPGSSLSTWFRGRSRRDEIPTVSLKVRLARGQILVVFLRPVLIGGSRRGPDVGFSGVQRLSEVQVEVEVGRGVLPIGVGIRLLLLVVVAVHIGEDPIETEARSGSRRGS